MTNFRKFGVTFALAATLSLGLTARPAIADPTNQSAGSTPTATCSASKALTDSALGKLYGYVINADTGKALIDISGIETTPSASVLKVMTVAAAIVRLPPTYRATTKVFTLPDQPGTIVLQGGGDHTLSRMTSDSYTTYYKPARLETLAAQVFAKWSAARPITKIILDTSFFSGPTYSPAWKLSDRTNGYISHITALQVDSDRANPDLTSTAYSGYRSANPVLAAGKFFKRALDGLADDALLIEGKTPVGAVEITRVNSQPINTWFAHAIAVSDNTETEYIARHAAKIAGLDPSFNSIQKLVTTTLNPIGIDTTGLVMKDGSGLAQGDRLTAKMVAELMVKVANNQSGLGVLETYLPIAGRTGTLAGRFNGANAVARGFVTGKSGYIPGLYSLAGIINAKDGSRLAYALFARSADGKNVGYSARAALDTAATRFYQCGAGLTL